MKTKSTARLAFPLACAIAALLAAPTASAAGPYYWDNNGATAGFGIASGTWLSTGTVGSTTQGWGVVTAGTTAPTGTITTLTTDAINFGYTTTGLGAGTITVSGTVSAGDITFAAGSGLITLSGGTITLAAAETMTVDNAADVITSAIAGAATSLTKAGIGTLTLSGSNSYTGQTVVNAGTLLTTATTALPGYNAAGIVSFNGGTLGVPVGGSGWTTAQVDTLLSNATQTSGALGIDTTNGDLSQWTAFTTSNLGATLGLAKLGNNTLTLNQVNSYAGTTTVRAGTLKLQDTGTGLTQTLGALALAGPDVTLQSDNAGSGTLSTTFGALTTRVAGNSANIASTGGTNGTTNLINLTGAAGFMDPGVFFGGSSYAALDATNTFVRGLAYGTDPNAATADTITASNHVQLTASPAAQPTISLLSLNLAGAGVNFAQTAATTLTVPGILKTGGGAVSTISGGTAVTAGAGVELVVRTDTSSDLLAISTPVTGTLSPLTKSGAGTLTLSAVNTYTGNTFVNSGTLALGGAGSLGSGTYAGAISIANGATFSHSSTAAQTLSGVISGAGTLAKSNSGTLTISGANAYTGGTVLSGGRLVSSATSSGLGTGTISFTGSAQLQPFSGGVTGTFKYPQAIALSNSATASFGGNGQFWFNGNVTGDGGITASTFNFGSVVILGGTGNTFTGPIIIGPGGSSSNWYNVQVASLADSPTANGMIELASASNYSSSGRSDGFIWLGATNLVLNNRQLVVASTTIMGGSFYNNSTNNSSITINTTVTGALGSFAAGARILSLGGTSTGTNTIAGSIVDGTSVTLTPTITAGTWEFGGTNTYTGATTIKGGTLSLTNSLALQNSALDTTNSIAGTASAGLKTTVTTLTLGGLTGNKNFAATGGVFKTTAGGYSSVTALTFNPGTGVTNSFAGIIADGAAGMTLTKTGLGTQILTNGKTYSGATFVNAGTLALGTGGALATTSSVSLSAGATFDVTALTAASATYAWNTTSLSASGTATPATLAGTAGGIIDLGSKPITLTYNGSNPALTVTGATLSLNNNPFTVNGAAVLANGDYNIVTASATITDGSTTYPTPTGTALTGKTASITVSGTNVVLHVSGAGSGYAGWAATNAPAGTAADDYDGDGVSNGVEYVLGGTKLTNDLGKLPTIATTGGNMVFTFKRDQTSIDGSTVVTIQVGTTLGSWPDTYNVGADTGSSSPGVTIVNGVPSGFDTITLTVPQAPDAKKFARLNVAVTP